MELLWDGGMKVSSNDSGHMTKMAAKPILYGEKPFKNLLLWSQWADDLQTLCAALGTWVLQSLFK